MHTPPRKTAFLAAAGYLLLALSLCLPALLAPEPTLIGQAESDMWKHVWGHWWLRAQQENGLHFPLETGLQNFPFGGTIFVIDPFNALVSALLQGFMSLHRAFDTIVILQLTLGAWSAWRLAYAVTGDGAASAVSGVVYGFSPWVLSYSVSSGVSETLGVAFIPLSALLMLRTASTGSLNHAVQAGLILTLAALNSWYYLVFAVALTLLLLTAAWLRPDDHGLPPVTRAGTRAAVAALLLSALLLAPLVTRFQASIRSHDSLGPRDRAAFTASDEFQETFFAVSDFVTPGKERLRVTAVVDRLAKTPYVGWLALLLAAIAVRHNGRRTRVWTVGAVAFFLLSLGPVVRYSEGLRSDSAINLLYWVARPLLGFSLASSPYRIHVLTTLCVGTMAAMALTKWTVRCPLLGGLVALLAFAETCWMSPAPVPLPLSPARIPAIYDGLALEEREGIIDLPPLRPGGALVPGEYYYYQTRHHGGIPYLVGGVFDSRLARNPLLCEMWHVASGRFPPTDDPLGAGRGLEQLAALGYRYVVLHDSLPPREHEYAAALLTRWLGPPQAWGDGCLRFALQPATSAARTAPRR